MAYTPLDEATKGAVLAEANARAKRFGISPEQALYNYARENNIDNSGIDTMMGFAQGGTDAWLKQRDASMATQANTPVVSNLGMGGGQQAQTYQPLAQDHRAAVLAEAQNRANRFGISPEQALYNYARENNIDNADVDTLMGFATGSTDAWLKQRDAGMAAQHSAPQAQQPAPQGNSYTAPVAAQQGSAAGGNLGLGTAQSARTYQPLDATTRANVLAEAQRRASVSGQTPEQELYNYAKSGGIDNAGIDTLMGFAQGGTDAWLKQQGNLGMGGYNPQQNPYLRQMGVDVGNQMFDQWSRNTLPSIRSGAMAAGGFGGSRQGVVEANGMNDMNRQYGQALTSMYGNDWSQQQGRNLQQQGLNNSYDLGLRSSDLGFANLDANIAQNNFGNQMQAANFGMGVYNTLNNQTQTGIQAGTNIQNTPLDYQKYFTNSANGVGSGYSTGTTSQTNQGNPWLGALGGAMMGNQIQKNWG